MKDRRFRYYVSVVALTALAGCQNPATKPQPTAKQTHVFTEVFMTAVDFENAKTRFKTSSGNRASEARLLAPVITPGMSRTQVKEILGEPDSKGALQSTPDRWNYTLFYSQSLSVLFRDDVVLRVEGTGLE